MYLTAGRPEDEVIALPNRSEEVCEDFARALNNARKELGEGSLTELNIYVMWLHFINFPINFVQLILKFITIILLRIFEVNSHPFFGCTKEFLLFFDA